MTRPSAGPAAPALPPAPPRRWSGWRPSMVSQDVAFAVRTLLRSPGFAAAVILTLALGIGANAAVFSLVHSLLIDPLPFPGGDRTVQLWRHGALEGERVLDRPGSDMVVAWRDTGLFDRLAGYTEETVNLRTADYPLSVPGSRISSELLPLIGATPIHGRFFTRTDGRTGGEPVVVLSEELWATRYGGDPGIVGARVVVDDVPHTVVGIVAASDRRTLENRFFGGQPKALFLPLEETPDGAWPARPNVVARLMPGLDPGQARAELDVIQTRLPDSGDGYRWHPYMVTAAEAVPANVRMGLWMLMAAVGMVLLIACANTANLLLARNLSRKAELRTRLAMGAGRFRLAHQLVTESAVLTVAGLVAAVLIAHWLAGAADWIAGGAVGELRDARIEPATFAFAIGLAVVIPLLISVAPLQYTLRLAGAGMADLDRARRGGPRGWRLHRSLVVVQVALTVVLVSGAGLLSRSLWRLLEVDTGLDTAGLVAVQIDLPPSRYEEATARLALFREVADRVEALPDVRAVGWARAVPPRIPGAYGRIRVEGRPRDDTAPEDVHAGNWVSPEYFRAAGTPVLEGRSFTPDDIADRAPVVILNRSAADRYWPDGDAVGGRITLASAGYSSPWLTVVGIVPDVKAWWLGDRPDRIQIYLPVSDRVPHTGAILVRTSGDPDRLLPAIRTIVADADPLLPVGDAFRVEDAFRESVARQRFQALALGAFGGAGILLALLGVYSVLALAVSRRRREIGIRLALGATEDRITRLVVGQGLRAVSAGTAIGLVLALASSRSIAGLLWGTRTTDIPTYVATLALVLGAGLAASYLPTRRATAVDPAEAMRVE